MRRDWEPFVQGPLPDLAIYTRLGNVSSTWKNNRYAVLIADHETAMGPVKQAMIRRHDGEPIRSWADMQRIKNELFGPEALGIEVFPPSSKLVDRAMMYHLWILPTGFQLPFGME